VAGFGLRATLRPQDGLRYSDEEQPIGKGRPGVPAISPETGHFAVLRPQRGNETF